MCMSNTSELLIQILTSRMFYGSQGPYRDEQPLGGGPLHWTKQVIDSKRGFT